jgi:transposase
MAGLLIEARDAARDARAAGEKALDPDVLGDLVDRYRDIATSGLAANVYRQTPTSRDANNEAERTIRPVKVQQRASGGCWRTLDGLAGFAVVQSYLSTAAKWGVLKIDALRGLFNSNPWMPPGIEPDSPDNQAISPVPQQAADAC